MESIKSKGFGIDIHSLHNKVSDEYKKLITDKWNAKSQLIQPNIHRQNAAKRVILMFEAHLLSILAGVAADFPRYMWDLLIPQAEPRLNFLRQATLKKKPQPGSFSMVCLTTTTRNSASWGCPSSLTTSQGHATPGTSAARTAGALTSPSSTTGASDTLPS
ncbi:hypothetical protein ACHAWF_011967 [Thalassiosira exigua]